MPLRHRRYRRQMAEAGERSRKYRGGVWVPFLAWWPWPVATLTVTADSAQLRSIFGTRIYMRSAVDRVHLRKTVFRWSLRFYAASGREISPRLRFLPPTSKPVMREMVALGWPAE